MVTWKPTPFLLFLAFSMILLGCQAETEQKSPPAYSGGCGVQAENIEGNYCEIINGVRNCYVKEGF